MTGAMTAFTLSDACMKALGLQWPLFQSIFLRGCGTTLLLGGLAWSLGQLRGAHRGDWGLMLLRTACEIGATWFYLTALNAMPLANVAAIHQAVPLTVTLAGALILGERVGPKAMLTILVGLGGVLLIIQPGGAGFTWASLYVLGSVAFVTVRDIASRAVRPAVPSLLMALAAAVGVTVFGATGAIFVDWQPVTPLSGLLLGGTILSVLVGYIGSVAAMRVGEIAFVTPFRYTGLLVAILLGAVAFGTYPDRLATIGAAVVVAAGAVTLLRERFRPRPEEEFPPGAA